MTTNKDKDPRVIKIGDIVRVIGTGIPMTAEVTATERRVKCVWFNENNDLCRDEFHVDTLEFVDDD